MSEKNKQEENREQIKAIKDKAGEKHNHQKLTINRAPDEAVGNLQNISYELFAGDYGATLMYLTKLHDLREQFNKQIKDADDRIRQLQQRISVLEEKLSEQQKTESSSKVDTIAWKELMTNEKLEKLTADGKTVEIDDVEFDVKPLTMKEFLKSQQIGQDNQGEGLLEMLYHSLKKDEEITKQGLKDAPAKVLKPLQDAVNEVNDFEDFFDEDEKQEALKKLQ